MQYFTILLKENSSDNHKLLTEKMNEGFYIDSQISVGRSTTIVLRKPTPRNERNTRPSLANEFNDAVQEYVGSIAGSTLTASTGEM